MVVNFDVVDKALAVGSSCVSVLAFVFYKLYRNRTETARQVRNIQIWNPDPDLYNHLNLQESQCLAYAAVEGVVKEMNRVLHSHHRGDEGVILHSEIIEHQSKRVNGFWSDVKKVIRDTTEIVPFALIKAGQGDMKYRIEVLEPSQASNIQEELDTVFDHFEPNKSGLMQVGLDRLFGEVTKGIQETESMLLTGTSVLGIGKVFLERGQVKLGPPDDTSMSYIITKMRLPALVRSFESQSSTFKILSILCLVLGGGMLSYLIWRHLQKVLEQNRRREEFEEIRRSIAASRSRVMNNDPQGEVRDEETCVVCLTNARQVIVLNCGHICLCAQCAELLPSPRRCPVCRAEIDRFMPVYRP
ncbi:unnamed protein product [Lymnaea stagnalis]|uniref:RING-type E3 ubiquitin transferase n=1 Tax=Lymnaea stagnalis TaxID=6523 RepID=A0AAV2I480_LYMST